MNSKNPGLKEYAQQIADIRAIVHEIVVSVQWQEKPRMPFAQFCLKNFITGEKYDRLMFYVDEIYNDPTADQLADLSDKFGIPQEHVEDCLKTFGQQHRRNGSRKTFKELRSDLLKLASELETQNEAE